ncbi:MAG: hypothetical protein K6T35_09565 [Meiothermus silvanus]|nr:hypothetical protein [Allomeiothermus silvanus]MCL6569111.1 hypothetical protein [Allomeiothermus silvanus]
MNEIVMWQTLRERQSVLRQEACTARLEWESLALALKTWLRLFRPQPKAQFEPQCCLA